MGRSRTDRASRWPWGVWFALVGVSAGTVASFALVGWAFVAATGPNEAIEAAPVPADETVVLEAAPEAEEPEPPAGPAVEPPLVSEPEAERVPDPDLEPAAAPEAEADRPEESGGAEEEPRLVPLTPPEDRRECGRPESGEALEPDLPNENSIPEPDLEHRHEWSPRPEG